MPHKQMSLPTLIREDRIEEISQVLSPSMFWSRFKSAIRLPLQALILIWPINALTPEFKKLFEMNEINN